MSRIRVSAGAIRAILGYDINNYAYRGGCYYLARPKTDMIIYVKKKKEELRSIGEGQGWSLLI